MKLITVKEMSERWNLSERRIQMLCNENRIEGAVRFGKVWMIPENAIIIKKNYEENPNFPMPRKTPFLDMTSIYNEKGCAEKCAKVLINNPEAYALFEALIAYRRGEISKVYEKARYFLDSHSGFYAILGGGMLLAFCAIWLGDYELWNEAKKHVCEAPCTTQDERDIISLSLAIIDSSIYDNKDYPNWFKKGNFEILPPSSHPSAKVFYAKYLYMSAFGIASKQLKIEGMEGLSYMRMISQVLEPLITQAVVDKTIIPEIYLRLSCAVAYYNIQAKEDALIHLDKAISLALADKLYGILTEYIRHFDGLLEERIGLQDKKALGKIKELYKMYSFGWNKLSSAVKNKYIIELTQKEHEIAKLTVFGFSVEDISKLLNITIQEVKDVILTIMKKMNVFDIKEFSYII